jgi:hypothetical protein
LGKTEFARSWLNSAAARHHDNTEYGTGCSMNAYHGRNVSRRQWQFTVAVLACALIAGLGYSPILMAETHRYQASLHEADWQVSASVFECRLFQTIPGFGEAEFVHQAGEALEFRIDSYADVVDGGDLVLRSEPPPWNFKRQAPSWKLSRIPPVSPSIR